LRTLPWSKVVSVKVWGSDGDSVVLGIVYDSWSLVYVQKAGGLPLEDEVGGGGVEVNCRMEAEGGREEFVGESKVETIRSIRARR